MNNSTCTSRNICNTICATHNMRVPINSSYFVLYFSILSVVLYCWYHIFCFFFLSTEVSLKTRFFMFENLHFWICIHWKPCKNAKYNPSMSRIRSCEKWFWFNNLNKKEKEPFTKIVLVVCRLLTWCVPTFSDVKTIRISCKTLHESI